MTICKELRLSCAAALVLCAVSACIGAARPAASRPDPEGEQVGRGVWFPEYDDENRLKSQFFGEKARVMTNGNIAVTGLRLELYHAGVLDVRVTSPVCVYERADGRVTSTGAVHVAGRGVTITGHGFEYTATSQSFRIQRDARVLIDEELASDAAKKAKRDSKEPHEED